MALPLLPSAPADFDFVIGDWTVKHRQLAQRLAGSSEWIEFDGAMSTRAILGGFGNIEDNRLFTPAGEVRAAALRAFDRNSGTWSIWWLDGRFPDSLDVPVVGHFVDRVGTFFAEDTFEGAPISVRFTWSRSDAGHLRWEQAFSPDRGATWETNWTMAFTRADSSR